MFRRKTRRKLIEAVEGTSSCRIVVRSVQARISIRTTSSKIHRLISLLKSFRKYLRPVMLSLLRNKQLARRTKYSRLPWKQFCIIIWQTLLLISFRSLSTWNRFCCNFFHSFICKFISESRVSMSHATNKRVRNMSQMNFSQWRRKYVATHKILCNIYWESQSNEMDTYWMFRKFLLSWFRIITLKLCDIIAAWCSRCIKSVICLSIIALLRFRLINNCWQKKWS